ncbi:MAG: hypothetical protein ABJE95_27515 [Byssovorax sp.]
MITIPPCCENGLNWLRAQHGRRYLAALTGQDSAALTASLHALDLYLRSDQSGREHAITALRALVAAMQPGCRVFVRAAMPYWLGLADVEKIWPQISGEAS